jgi:hypothetical protein
MDALEFFLARVHTVEAFDFGCEIGVYDGIDDGFERVFVRPASEKRP